MSLFGDGLRLAAGLADGAGVATRRASSLALGPIWGAITTPDRVVLTEDADGPRTISYEEILRSQPIVASATGKIARNISRLPLRAYKGDPDGDYEPVGGDHDLSRLVRRPAPRRGATHLKQSLVLPTLVHGNSTMGFYRGNGPGRPPTELLKLDWPFMNAYARRGGPVEFWTSTQADGQEHALAAENVLHVAWEPPSGALGISPLEQLGTTVALDEAARRYQAASYRNGVRPSGALVLPKDSRTSPEERVEMRRDIERMHSGVDQSFRMALLSGGAQWEPMSFNAAEAGLIESRLVNREEACMVYDMPPALLGDTRDSTYSNVTEFNAALFKIHLPPWLVLIEDTLQAQLIDPEPEWQDLFVRFDVSAVLKGDPLAEANAQAALVREGLITRDEGRTRLGLKKMGGKAAELTLNANNQGLVNSLDGGTKNNS